jgi:hypothetical protein
MDEKVGKKKTVTMTIDEKIWELAKKKISNISQTTEEMLKVLINLENANETKIVQEISETEEEIKRGHGKLLILRDQLEKLRNETRYNMQETENNRAWRMAFNIYTRHYNIKEAEDNIQKAVQVLGVERDVFERLLEEAAMEQESKAISLEDSQIWEFIKNRYKRFLK